MGAGTRKLYENGKVIGKRAEHAVYKSKGNPYMVTGCAWTGWGRLAITEEQYQKVLDYAASKAERYSVDVYWKPTRLQLARRATGVMPPETVFSIIKG